MKSIADDRATQMVRLYGPYQDHVLPFSGGFLEQSNYYIEAMGIIRGLMDGD